MKNSFKYMACASAVAVALIGCTKQNKEPEQAEAHVEVQKPEVTTLEVVERPILACDDVSLKNRVVNLVREDLLKQSYDSMEVADDELKRQLKARVLNLDIDLQNVMEDDGRCRGLLHIVLPDEEIKFADEMFAKEGKFSLQEQAIKQDVSLMGGNRLVADLVFQIDGESLIVDKAITSVPLVAKTMAIAVDNFHKMDTENAKRETAKANEKADDVVVSAPSVQIRPVTPPKVDWQKEVKSNNLPKLEQPTTKRQQPSVVEEKQKQRVEPKVVEEKPKAPRPTKEEVKTTEIKKPAETKKVVETKKETPAPTKAETPKPAPKAETTKKADNEAQKAREDKARAEAERKAKQAQAVKSEPKPEPKPKPTPKPEPKPEPRPTGSSVITITESNETY